MTSCCRLRLHLWAFQVAEIKVLPCWSGAASTVQPHPCFLSDFVRARVKSWEHRMHNNLDRCPAVFGLNTTVAQTWALRDGGSQKQGRQAAARRQIKRDSQDRCSWGVNPVCEWVIMFIHPAVAPSEATGFAGSLMRRRLRLLQEGRLTRLFLSLSETANQVRWGRG